MGEVKKLGSQHTTVKGNLLAQMSFNHIIIYIFYINISIYIYTYIYIYLFIYNVNNVAKVNWIKTKSLAKLHLVSYEFDANLVCIRKWFK